MIYGSVCSGIEAASVAWHPLGWRAAFVSDIEKFPSAVLAHHYPDVPNHGDMTKFKEWPDHAIDLLVGGTPCQSFSVAGLRKGLADPRGNLMLTYLAIADRYRPRWLVWENVPGVLSADGGRAFGTLLGGLGQLGYGFAYRVLDAQYFGVPQRRRRVFVVGYLGDWRRAAAVLFERHSLQGNPAPRREAGKGIAPTISARTKGGGGLGTDFDCDGGLIEQSAFGGNNTAGPIDVSTALNAHGGPAGRLDFESKTFIAHSLRAEGFDASEDGTGRGTPLVPSFYSITPSNSNTDYNARLADKAQAVTTGGNRPSARGGDLLAFSCKDYGADADADADVAPTLRSMGHDGSHANGGGQVAVAYDLRGREGGAQFEGPHDTANIRAGSGGSSRSYVQTSGVRRLIPEECEALQGFKRGYTLITYRGKPAADGPRYKALGNSMAVPVMAWIGQRIAAVDEIQ